MGRRPTWPIAIWSVLLLLECAAGTLSSAPGFTSSSRTFTGFKTEPTFAPEEFDIHRIPVDKTRLEPGYIFIDPIWEGNGWGPQIYTMDGTLIWHGPRKMRSQNVHVCDYLGEKGTHLCYSVRNEARILPESIYGPDPRPTIGYNWNIILDDTYTQVKPNYTRAAFEDLPLNGHAFEVLPEGYTSVALVGRPEKMDLRPYGGLEEGWTRNQCIEEFDLETEKSLFHWCYLQSGLKVWETQIFFNHSNAWLEEHPENLTAGSVGSGSLKNPWDFLHFNAVDKNSQGDYYISSRHSDEIIKIAGNSNSSGAEPGTVLWRLGGKGNSFGEFKGFPIDGAPPFSRPHDVRTISASGTEEVISLMNNAWEGVTPPSQNYSDGQFIHIDTATMTATLLRSYPHPNGTVSPGRGNVQQLGNGNVLIGWGKVPEFTEFDADGTPLYHVKISQPNNPDPEFSYRVIKSPWVGKPHWDPKLAVHERASTSTKPGRRPALDAYVSWNGATEVKRWRFSVRIGNSGPWEQAGVSDKDGYETKFEMRKRSCVPSYVRAVALDGDGNILGRTIAATGFRSQLMCENFLLASLVAVLLVLVTVEAFIFVAQSIWYYILFWNSEEPQYSPWEFGPKHSRAPSVKLT